MTLAGPFARSLGAVVGLVLLTGCGPGPEEPVGLAASPDSAATPEPAEPSDTEEAPGGGTEGSGDAAEPEPSFTQPFVPGEPHVIALADALPVEPPDGASADDAEVVAALGRFMASWDAILFGAGVEEAALERTATGPQLERLGDYAAESRELGRVVVGEPSRLHVRSVTSTADRSEVDVCLTMTGWIEYRGGLPTPLPETERYLVVMTRSGSDWRAADTDERDAAACSA